ncbi:MAG: hypothetical protein CMJ24_07560 [Phycisphaerae bacterium]|nr:hypothetical protein [Phycisphaerae bacterium]
MGNVSTHRGYHGRMSGEATFIEVQLFEGPLPSAHTPSHDGGGACCFEGRTRPERHPEHRDLISLDYEAYPPLATRTMQDLAETASNRWPCRRIDIHHATGIVPVGAISVRIHVACDHRSDAFEACRWLIDSLKQQVPIWKREHWADGTTWVDGEPVRRTAP